jgi:hypothetical protein
MCNLLSNEYRGLYSLGQTNQSMKLTARLRLLPDLETRLALFHAHSCSQRGIIHNIIFAHKVYEVNASRVVVSARMFHLMND